MTAGAAKNQEPTTKYPHLMPLKKRMTFALMIAFAVWVLFVCISVEILNAHAGHWLAQPEAHDPDAGKWRASGDVTREQLREWLRGPGMLQYLLAPFATLLSFAFLCSQPQRSQRFVACLFCVTSAIVVALTFYRGYWSALG